MKITAFISALLCIFCSAVSAQNYANVQKSFPSEHDPRIRFFHFVPDGVYEYMGYILHSSYIEFGQGEEVKTITMGDSKDWQIKPVDNRIFIKPHTIDAQTHMTVFTNKRLYFFELNSDEADDFRQDGLSFVTRFLYPNVDQSIIQIDDNFSFEEEEEEELPTYQETPDKYNFRYTLSGSEKVAPIRVFDDGEFTYLQFRDRNAVIPAIFEVDSHMRESLVNYRMTGDYIVLERTASQYTLRYGDEIACIFNELQPLQHKTDQHPTRQKFFGIF